MSFSLSTLRTVVAIVGGTFTIAATVWKVALPLLRKASKMNVVYGACIAELSQYAPGLIFETPLDKIVPIRRFPGYSDWSIQGPNLPPRSRKERNKLFQKIDSELAGEVLKEANEWERNCPPELTLLSQDSSRAFELYQTYLRLRWLLVKDATPNYDRVAHEISLRCAEALRSIESETQEHLAHLPTRVLIVRVKNRGSRDAKDLHIDVTSGGEIYDVVINDRQPTEIEKTDVRLTANYKVLRPGQTVELKLWYRWLAVDFGSRIGSQAETFPGREGILITYLGVSNGHVLHMPQLLSDVEAWRSLDTKIGPEPGFGKF
jgi:hypothetical protein